MTPQELDHLLDYIELTGVAEPLVDLLAEKLSLKKPYVKESLRTLIRFINQTKN